MCVFFTVSVQFSTGMQLFVSSGEKLFLPLLLKKLCDWQDFKCPKRTAGNGCV